MKTENLNNHHLRTNNKSLLLIIIFASSFVIYYSIMSMIGPSRKLSELESKLGNKPDEIGNMDERIFSDSTYIKLLSDRSLLSARIAMAGSDSNYLTVSLLDSTANIEISGVVVHESRISSIQLSRILKKSDQNIIQIMLASAFRIVKDYSTIQKEPVMIKIAPKDTSEYKPDVIPDTSITEPVYYFFELNNGIRLYICQEEDESFADKLARFNFNITDRFRNTWMSLKKVMVFKVPEYHPFIKISLPRSDAKIIYRAIPQNGQIGIYI